MATYKLISVVLRMVLIYCLLIDIPVLAVLRASFTINVKSKH